MTTWAVTSAADLVPTRQPTKPWNRHTIDNTSRGADGVRLADANGDGLLDITTAWEEGGVVRVYLNPGPKKAKSKWPAVTVGKVKSGEDAVFVDLDNNGAMDVVSSCEGKTRTMYVHWAPKNKTKYLDAAAWKTEAIPATQGKQLWMFCLPMDVDGKHGIDLVVGSKGGGATVGWLESPHPPKSPRDLKAWKFHEFGKAGWIMSLIKVDYDGDHDDDIVFSDRKGALRGVYWIENRNRERNDFPIHQIGAANYEVMFIDVFRPSDGKAGREPRGGPITVAAKPRTLLHLPGKRTLPKDEIKWEMPAFTGTMKAARMTDIDGDDRIDVVVTCEHATAPKSGLYWIEIKDKTKYEFHDIAGPKGVKFDRIELIDLDNDGDLDILTCEERDNLGVIWYENPTKSR